MLITPCFHPLNDIARATLRMRLRTASFVFLSARFTLAQCFQCKNDEVTLLNSSTCILSSILAYICRLWSTWSFQDQKNCKVVRRITAMMNFLTRLRSAL